MFHYNWASAWAFWLFPLLAMLVAFHLLRRRHLQPTMLFSNIEMLKAARQGLRVKLAWLPFALKVGAIAFAILALARPQKADSRVKRFTEGIDIMLVLDISDSMMIEDMDPLSRIDSAKGVLTNFVKSRPSDRMGLVAFKGEAYTRVPLTLDHDLLLKNIAQLDPTSRTMRDGTAIGSALSLAVARLKDSTAKSRVIVLATDGENNSGTIDPETALEIAKGYGLRIYTIGMGKDGQSLMPVYGVDAFGNKIKRYQEIHSSVNDKLLGKMADETGGKYYRASSGGALDKVFRSIDHLEKTKIEQQQYVRYDELFGRFLLVGLVLMILSLFLDRALFVRVP